jgi:hypothetical protein
VLKLIFVLVSEQLLPLQPQAPVNIGDAKSAHVIQRYAQSDDATLAHLMSNSVIPIQERYYSTK